MNLVVSFLSMLVTEEENGGVKRMLGVCSEFERIAKVVLDKAEKEQSSRRKRKNVEEQKGGGKHTLPQTPMQGLPQQFSPPSVQGHLPAQNGHNGNNGLPHAFSPNLASSSPQAWTPTQHQQPSPNPSSYSHASAPSDFMTPQPFNDLSYSNNDFTSPEYQSGSPQMMNGSNGMFQGLGTGPFVPQDLWQMPMSLEWDWADMTGGAYPSFENGIVADPSLGPMNGAGNGGSDNNHLGQNGMR
jgi:hypothetical protein